MLRKAGHTHTKAHEEAWKTFATTSLTFYMSAAQQRLKAATMLLEDDKTLTRPEVGGRVHVDGPRNWGQRLCGLLS